MLTNLPHDLTGVKEIREEALGHMHTILASILLADEKFVKFAQREINTLEPRTFEVNISLSTL